MTVPSDILELSRSCYTELRRAAVGIATTGLEFQGKRLELLREPAPDAARIALLVNPGNPATGGRVRATEAAARVLGAHVSVVEVRAHDELNGAVVPRAAAIAGET